MSNQQINETSLAYYSNPTTVYYHEDGSLNLDELRYYMQRHFALNPDGSVNSKAKIDIYSSEWLIYFFTKLDVSRLDHQVLMDVMWDAFNHYMKHEMYGVFSKMIELGVDIHSTLYNYLQHLQQRQPSATAASKKSNTFVFDVLEFGLSLYNACYPDMDHPIASYIPNIPWNEEDMHQKLMKVMISFPHFSYIPLVNRLYEEQFPVLGESIIRMYFRRLFVKQVGGAYSVEYAITTAWPTMYAHGVSMVETLKDIKNTTKGKSFYSNLLSWYVRSEEDTSPEVIEARRQFLEVTNHVIEARAMDAAPWTEQDLLWVPMCVDMDTTHPLYAKTRLPLAQVLFTYRQRYSIANLFYYVLRCGQITFDAFLEHYKTSDENTNEILMGLLTQSDSPNLRYVTAHPLFTERFDTTSLFHHVYAYLSRKEKGTLSYSNKNDPYINAWKALDAGNLETVRDYMNVLNGSSVRDILRGLRRFHQNMNLVEPFDQFITKEMHCDFMVQLGLTTFLVWKCLSRYPDVAKEGKLGFNSFLTPFYASDANPDIPQCVTYLYALDPNFMCAHKDDVRELVRHTSQAQSLEIYAKWIKEWFGELVFQDEFINTFVKDEQSFIQFFREQYIMQHPDFGMVLDEIPLEDLF